MSMNETCIQNKIAKKLARKIRSKQEKPAYEQAKSAYQQFLQVQNIDVEKQSQINWKELKARLRNPADPRNVLTEEMRKFLTEKLHSNARSANAILTPEEKVFLKRLTASEDSTWELRHATHDYETIKSEAELFSIEERKRRGLSVHNGHTNPSEGHTDNVFLSIAPGKGSTVRFLDDAANTVITFDYAKELQQGKKTFAHLWSSGHMFAFSTEQNGEPVHIAGTKYVVNYKKETDPRTGEAHELKYCTFTHPNGEQYVQVLTKADEIYIHPRIDIALVLMSIEKIRLLGKQAWEQIMDPSLKLEALQAVVKALFHTGLFEVHKPARLPIDPSINPNISIKQSNALTMPQNESINMHMKVIRLALKGAAKEVIEAIQQNNDIVNINADMPATSVNNLPSHDLTLSILGAAILGGPCELVDFLLKNNADLVKPCLAFSESNDPTNPYVNLYTGKIQINLFTLALLRSDTTYIKKLFTTIFGTPDLKDNKTHAEDTCVHLLQLLSEQGTISKECELIVHPALVTVTDINAALALGNPSPKVVAKALTYLLPHTGQSLSLTLAVASGSTTLVKKMLELGANINETFNPREEDSFDTLIHTNFQDNFPSIFPGFTPLITAIQFKNEEMVTLLLDQGANIHHIFSTVITDDGLPIPILVTPQEGFTPLFFAIQSLNKNIILTLLKRGADIHHKAAKNQTVMDLAKAQENPLPLLELLNAPYVDAQNKNAVEQSLLNLATEASAFDIHHHKTTFLITGIHPQQGRFYLLNKEQDAQDLFSLLFSHPLRQFSEQEAFLSKALQLKEIELKNAYTAQSLGILSYGNPHEKTHYAHQLVAIEFNAQISEKLFNNTRFQFFSKAQYEESVKNNLNDLGIHFHEKAGVSTTTALLTLLFAQDKLIQFSTIEMEELNKHYVEFHGTQHQLIYFIRAGRVRSLQKLLAEKQPLMEYHTPTIRKLDPDCYKENTFYAHTDVPFEVAIACNNVEILRVLSTHPAIKQIFSSIGSRFMGLNIFTSIYKHDSVEMLGFILESNPMLLQTNDFKLIDTLRKYPAFRCWEFLIAHPHAPEMLKWGATDALMTVYNAISSPSTEQNANFISALNMAITHVQGKLYLNVAKTLVKALMHNHIALALHLLAQYTLEKNETAKTPFLMLYSVELDRLISENPQGLLQFLSSLSSNYNVWWSPFDHIIEFISKTELGQAFVQNNIDMPSRKVLNLNNTLQQKEGVTLHFSNSILGKPQELECKEHKDTQEQFFMHFEEPDTKTANEKYHIFISTAHKDPNDELSGTGDVDYAEALKNSLNLKNSGSTTYIRNMFSESQIYAHIRKHQATEIPVLHVMINAPRTGFAFSPEGLENFKRSGGMIIMTAIEFYKFEHRDHTHILDSLKYLKKADKIIFLDEIDKKSALEQTQRLGLANDADFVQKLTESRVIPVPPTILVTTETQARGGDIISFGMIRAGKGLAHVIKLAQLIQKSADEQVKNKKVLVVGTVKDQDRGSQKELVRLMESVYPNKKQEIKSACSVQALKILLKKYQTMPELLPAIPLEIHVDVAVGDLLPLFSRCTYSFLPAFRGATLRNSSISSSIAQGWITYSHSDRITPDSIRTHGNYASALVCLDNLVNEHGDTDFAKYADTVLIDIQSREVDSTLNVSTQRAAAILMKEVLSRETVRELHQAIYNAKRENVPVVMLSQSLPSSAENTVQLPAMECAPKEESAQARAIVAGMTMPSGKVVPPPPPQ